MASAVRVQVTVQVRVATGLQAAMVVRWIGIQKRGRRAML